jgi:hypothetical protein
MQPYKYFTRSEWHGVALLLWLVTTIFTIMLSNIRIDKRTRITKGKSRMDNPEKLAILGTQVSLIKIQTCHI